MILYDTLFPGGGGALGSILGGDVPRGGTTPVLDGDVWLGVAKPYPYLGRRTFKNSIILRQNGAILG